MKQRKDKKQVLLYAKIAKKCYRALRTVLHHLGRRKTAKTYVLLGYGPTELKSHLEKHPNWPTVKNGKWHLDHVFPIKAFLDYGIDEISVINCLDNLQPLAEFCNLSKGFKYDKDAFESWLQSRQLIVSST